MEDIQSLEYMNLVSLVQVMNKDYLDNLEKD